MADEGRQSQGEERGRQTLKVTDRRHFTADGERRSELDEPEEVVGTRVRPESPAKEAAVPASDAGFERRSLDEPEGVDFTMLINAMAQPALLFLGEIPHPGTGKPTFNPEQARLQIDMLDLLRVKCRGNLSAEEEGLLERVLYQLRMLYVARTGPQG
jgi:hypothetical protein